MSYLLRVALPDVPGSLGRLASAIGSAGGNIDAIEIVERTHDGRAVDDVFLAADTGRDAGQHHLRVHVARGRRGALDLPLRRRLQPDPRPRGRRGDDLGARASPGTPWSTCCPAAFVVDWAARVRREGDGAKSLHGTHGRADRDARRHLLARGPRRAAAGSRCRERLSDLLVAGCALGDDEMVVIARRGGPEILDSEIARLCHLAALAASISRLT